MAAIATEERATTADARAALYRFLSQALSYPDPAALSTLLDQDLPLAADAAEVLGEDVAAPLAAIGHRLAHAAPDQVARDFERIFTHVLSVDWPPYETAYTSKGIFQQANDLADIAGFYAAYGTEVSEDARERPDHIAIEMELMHLLACKEAFALRNHTTERADACREDARRFLEDHLGRWAPEFARRLARGAAGSPYGDVAELCAAFLAGEVEAFGVSPEPVDGAVAIVEPEGRAFGPCEPCGPDEPCEPSGPAPEGGGDAR